MAIQFISVKCPDCGAELSIDNSREFAFCSYCGAKVMVHNDNEHIYRNIDEARIKEAETDRIVKLRQLDMEEKSSFSRKSMIIAWAVSTGVLLLLGIIGFTVDNMGMGMCMMFAMLVGMSGFLFLDNGKKKPKVVVGTNQAMITGAMVDAVEKNYNNAVLLFKGAGFTNVTPVPLNDLGMFNQRKNGQVETITINGNEEFEEGDVFPKNANILITYHSK